MKYIAEYLLTDADRTTLTKEFRVTWDGLQPIEERDAVAKSHAQYYELQHVHENPGQACKLLDLHRMPKSADAVLVYASEP